MDAPACSLLVKTVGVATEVLVNTLQAHYRARVENAVRKAIGDRPGFWAVALASLGVHAAFAVMIACPDGRGRSWTFQSPDDPIQSRIEEDLTTLGF